MTDVDVAPSELSAWLIGQGRHFISTGELAEIYDISPSSGTASLERAREARKLISVTKGGWVPVPAEYRSAGAPPPSHFIHQLMDHLGHPYYAGLLSAAAIHGAAHQSPMVFQVVTPAKLRERKVGRGRLQFIQRSAMADRPRQQRIVPTGRIWVATPEVTVFDLVESPNEGGGLSNVATVIGELVDDEHLEAATLASVAAPYPGVVAQRVGYLVDLMAGEVGAEFDTDPLHNQLRHVRFRELSPNGGDGDHDQRWYVIANADIEHDL